MSFEPTKATKTTKKQPAKTNINNTNHQHNQERIRTFFLFHFYLLSGSLII